MPTVAEVFKPMLGKWAWQVRRGHGSFLTMEFGEPHLVVRHPRSVSDNVSDRVKRNFQKRRVSIVGEWHFWVQSCDWKITTSNSSISSEDTDFLKVDSCLEELDGQVLLASNEDASRASCTLEFDLGARLALSPSPNFMDDDQWAVYYFGQTVYAYRSHGEITMSSPS